MMHYNCNYFFIGDELYILVYWIQTCKHLEQQQIGLMWKKKIRFPNQVYYI